MAADHICKYTPVCSCSLWGIEPSEHCEVHSPWSMTTIRCDTCGRFLPHESTDGR